MNFLYRIIEPFITPLVGIAAALAVLAGMSIYDAWIDDPAVARAAREGYVRLAEKTALEAKLAEERRLRKVAENAVVQHAIAYTEAQRRYAAQIEQAEQERAEYAARLSDQGCDRGLTDADIEWLRR